jgi:PAS domain S-box-containing protein
MISQPSHPHPPPEAEPFRPFFDRHPEPMWIVDGGTGAILAANDASVRVFGFARVALAGARMSYLCPGAGEGPVDGPRVFVRSDGEPVDVDVSSYEVEFHGRAARVVLARDLTGERQARRALEASERRFRAALHHAPIGMAMVGLDGRWLEANRALCRLTGYSESELRATRFQQITHPDDLYADLAQVGRLLAGEAEWYALEKRYLRKDGSPVWVLLTVSLVRGPDGGPLHFVAQVQDITERRAAEETLRRTAEHLQALVRTQQEVATAGLDLERVMETIVLRAMELTGAPGSSVEMAEGDDMVYRAAAGTLARYNGLRLPIHGSLSGMSVLTGRLLRADDTETDPRVHREACRALGIRSMLVLPLLAEGRGIGVIKVAHPEPGAFGERAEHTLALLAGLMAAALRDAVAYETEQTLLAASRRAESQMEAYARELERSNRELADFAYVASHDLQEPLRKIQAFGDRLAERSGPVLDEMSRDSLGRMQAAAGRMSDLIHALLDYSRVGTRPAPFTPVDLAQAARDAESDLAVRLHSTGGRVEIGALPEIEADVTMMRQLLLNLVGNAVKFHRPGVPPVVRVEGRLLAPDEVPVTADAGAVEWAEVTVRDNGIGFEDRFADRIFAPFQRLHGRGEYDGTGMGLAICRRIAERHGGTLEARGEPGAGSVFTVRLPVRRPATQEDA